MKALTPCLLACLALASLAAAQSPPAAPPDEAFPPVSWGHYRSLESKVLAESRRLLVRLPDDYATSGKKYPVVLKLDGEKGAFLHTLSAAYYLFDMTEGSPDAILVGLENTDRGRDMRPDRSIDRFITFLESELLPFVDTNYRTNGTRILCGQSLTAITGMYAFLRKPALFDGYVLSSFSLFNEDLKAQFDRELASNPALRTEARGGPVYLFVAVGTRDPYDRDGVSTRRGAAFLESLQKVVPGSVRVETRIYEGEGHVPYASFYDGLRWIYSGAKPRPVEP